MISKLMIAPADVDIKKYLIKNFDLNFNNNPDILEFGQNAEGLKIKQVREINQKILYPPIGTGRDLSLPIKYIIIYNFDLASIPAQNALLKSLEEPPDYVQFILIANNLNHILETIKSRCLIEQPAPSRRRSPAANINNIQAIYNQLNSSSYSQLINLASNYKDRGEATQLLSNLITYLHAKNQKQPNAIYTKQLKILIKYLNYLNQNSNVLLTLENCFFETKN